MKGVHNLSTVKGRSDKHGPSVQRRPPTQGDTESGIEEVDSLTPSVLTFAMSLIGCLIDINFSFLNLRLDEGSYSISSSDVGLLGFVRESFVTFSNFSISEYLRPRATIRRPPP